MRQDDDGPRPPMQGRAAPNYTTPFLVVLGVLVWIALVAIWGFFGMVGALLGAFAADRVIPSR